jgi:hypothetical protein
MPVTPASSAIQSYFSAKRKELMALAELPVCEHPGLIGGHREQIYRAYLADLLPRRYSVGRGMVYGMYHRSREADIVLWDSFTYPSLPLFDHSFYFAESVKAVIECKSNWKTDAFVDVLEKCKAVRDIVLSKEPSLADDVAMLQLDVAAMKQGVSHEGMLIPNHHIGTTAMFLRGGKSVSPKEFIEKCPLEIDDAWPDVMLFLEAGLLVTKNYPDKESNAGRVTFFRYDENALLAFSTALLKLIEDRVVHSESRFYLERYAFQILTQEPVFSHEFRLTRLSPGRVPLWG